MATLLSTTINGTLSLNTSTDQMITLNATDNSWAYLGFSWSGSRRGYFGLNSSGELEIGSDLSQAVRIVGTTTLTIGGNTAWHSGNLTNLNQLTNGPGYLTSLGFSYSTGVNANHVVQRDANGYIYANHINFSTPESENPSISSFFTSNGDGWSRKSSLQHVRNQLGNYGGWITGLSFDGLSSKTGGTGTYQTSGDFRAPIFYDSQDTFYYVDPNGTSRVSRFQPLNLGGATLQFRSTDLAVDSGSREAITFIDGSQVQAHVSTGTGCGGCCYNWWSSESIQVDAEKDYEFHVWVRSTGNDNVYLGWWEGDTSGSTITSNPYFHTGNINTGGTWVKLTAKLKNWRTASGQANTSGQDRYASANNMSNDLTGTIDGVMHSNTRFVHIRLGTCYGTVSGSKTYFYGAQVREAGYDDYQQNIVIPYYNGSSWGGKLRFGYNDWGYFGIGMYGAAGEFRMSSDSGDLNLRVDGWIRSENSLQSAGSLTVGGTSTLNGAVNVNRHIDANTTWGNCGCNSLFLGWSSGKVILGNNANSGHDYANNLGANTVVSTNAFFCHQDITAFSDARVKENVEVIENAVEKVKAIRGVTFTRSDTDNTEKRHAGVIAQEVLKVLPEVVSEDTKGYYSVAYGNLTSLLIEAIKEQQKQIDELKEQLKNK